MTCNVCLRVPKEYHLDSNTVSRWPISSVPIISSAHVVPSVSVISST